MELKLKHMSFMHQFETTYPFQPNKFEIQGQM
jgi:hypothetical protein